MKEYTIEIEIDENGDMVAETKGMQGKVCAEQLDSILKDISGEREVKNTGDYYKTRESKQTITGGR